jgi:hypothetical protein
MICTIFNSAPRQSKSTRPNCHLCKRVSPEAHIITQLFGSEFQKNMLTVSILAQKKRGGGADQWPLSGSCIAASNTLANVGKGSFASIVTGGGLQTFAASANQ